MLHNISTRFPIPERWAVLVVLVASVLAYVSLSQGLPGDFLLDDHARVKHVDIEKLDPATLAKAIMKTDIGVFGRVIPLLSLYVTKVTAGGEPELYRQQSIALHIICGLIVFWFCARLLTAGRFAHLLPKNTHWLIAASASAIWLVHPLQISTALYIVQQMTQYGVIFTLLALICYIASRQAISRNTLGFIAPAAGVVFFSVAGILSKESAALIPCFILLIEYFVFRFSYESRQELNRLIFLFSLLSIIPILLGFTYFLLHTDTLLHDYAMRPFTLTERIASESVIVWQYLGMLLLPRLSSMTLYHDGITIYNWSDPIALIAFLAWIALMGFLLSIRHKLPLVSFGLFFFLISHAMESTVLPLELMFEHRNYIGSIGIFFVLVSLLFRLRDLQPRLQPILITGFVTISLGLTLLQAARASAWSNAYAFAMISAREHPESARTMSMLANHQARRGYVEEARGLLETAIDKRPDDRSLPGLYLHLLMFYCEEDSYPQHLMKGIRQSMQENPLDSYVLSSLKVLRQRLVDGNCPVLSRNVLLSLEEIAADNPRTRLEYQFYFNSMAAITNGELRNFQEAKRYLLRALKFERSVSRESRRDHALSLTNVCIVLRDEECTASALDRARSIDEDIGELVGSHEGIPKLELLRNRIFTE